MDEKRHRRFRTLEEIEEEYNAQEHDLNSELKDVGRNLKEQLFSPWGMLVLFAMISGLLSAWVR